jgi:GH43 family beta-xylosidase
LTLTSIGAGASYLNPVYARSCPDPFVLKHAGEYWAYCTGLQPDGRAFGILRSADLVHWTEAGSALDLLPGDNPCYWAPEVAYLDGRFYLYYSVGDEATMHIRVAVADQPGGPFTDSGRRLTSEAFAIDGHVFIDDDGQRYFFYATDFLQHTHIGTGTVVDRLLDPLRLAGRPQPVSRARYDWQVYDPQRAEKGGVRWHTVEGPFVLKRKDRYHQMFSGGNWQNPTYGVSYAVSHTVLPEGEWHQVCDGQRVRPVLRSLPEAGIIGPGHNSVVRGPDNRQLFCIYHRWAPELEERVLAIDRLEWIGDRLDVLGPSSTPQPAPIQPAVAGFGNSASDALGAGWQLLGGEWAVRRGRARQAMALPAAAARRALPGPDFLLEVTLRALTTYDPGQAGSLGLSLEGEAGEALRVSLAPGRGVAAVALGTLTHEQALPAAFDFGADHLLRVSLNAGQAQVSLDQTLLRWPGQVGPCRAIALFTQEMPAEFAGLAITPGWQDDFDQAGSPAAAGWLAQGSPADWRINSQQLRQADAGAEDALLAKGTPLEAYELVINARLDSAAETGYGFYPCYSTEADRGPLFILEQHGGAWRLAQRPDQSREGGTPAGQSFALPEGFDPFDDQQFRFRLDGGRLSLQCSATHLGQVDAPARPGRVGLGTRRAAASFDMVRVTGLLHST